MITRAPRRFRPLLLLLVLLGAACGGSGGTSDRSDGGGEIDPTAVVRFTHYLGVSGWDPHQSPGGPDIAPLNLVYDTLVHVSKTAEAEPGLATSWEFDDTVTTLTMELREGVTFTDGTPFDAEVVVANIERAMTLPKSTSTSLLASVTSVEAVDDLTVQFNLSRPNSALPLTLAERPGMMISPELLSEETITEPIGSGMFVVTETTLGQSATFEKNEDYWDADNITVGGAELQVVADSTARLNSLISGSSDMTHLDTSMLSQLEQRDMTVATAPDLRFFGLLFNPDVVPEFADPDVRLALSLAVDRDAIVQGVFGGHGSSLDQPFPPNSPAYNEDIEGAWARDLERAEELLADAGLADGFSFSMVIGTDPVQGQVAEAVQAQLQDIGVDVEIQKLQNFGPAQAYWTDKTAGAALFRLTSQFAHHSTHERLYSAPQQNNPGSVTDPEITDLLDQAFAETDDEEIVSLVQEISAKLVEKPLSVIPLVQEEVVLAAGPDVEGLDVWYIQFPVLEGVGITK